MADITVTTLSSDVIDGSDGETTLREAVQAANAGDRIVFQAGLTGTLTLTQGQLTLDKDLTIDGDTDGDGKADVAISGDADGSGTGNAGDSRIFDLVAGTGTTNVELASLTLTGGFADNGGAIRGADQAVALILRDSTVDGNTSTQSGGGGIGAGGGIFFSGALTVVNSTISNNTAAYNGNGGGLALIYASAPAVLINTTFAGNYGGNDGGGIFLRGSDLALENATITDNTAHSGVGGGGIFMRDASNVSLRNSVVAQNANLANPANPGNNIAEFTTSTSTITSENSFFEDGIADWARPFSSDWTSDFTDLGGTILNGGDPRLGALQDNGGPVATRAPLANSPLIDAGGTPPADTFDADGDGDTSEALPIDANGNARSQVRLDIGAAEAPKIIVTTSDDVVNASDGVTSLREAITQATTTGEAIAFDLAPGDRTLSLAQGQFDISSDVRIDGDIDGDGKGDITISGNSNGDLFQDTGETRFFEVTAGTLLLKGLTLVQGFSPNAGGAIRVGSGGALEMLNVTLRDNDAASSGGALFVAGTATGTNVTINGNQSGAYGGGVYSSVGNVTLANTTVHGNTSAAAGGGIGASAGSLTLLNATVTGNTASGGGGGGIELYNSVDFTLHNSVFAGNTDLNGANQILDSGIDGDSIVTAKHNFFETSEVSEPGELGLSNGVDGNIVGGGDPGLLALADNGGPVETRAFAPESPLFDAGTAAEIPVDTLDADGDGNTVEGLPVSANGAPRQVGSNPDIGAFEFPRDINNLVVDTLIDEDDGDYREGDLSLREAIDIAAAGATITFAQGITGGTTAGVDDGVITLNGTQLAINRDVTIDGDTNGDNRADITLDGNDASRVMRLSGETTDVALHSLAITGGNTAGVAGGIYASFLGSLLIADSTASGNRASLGGGFFLSSRTDLTMINTLITGNESGSYGGGLALDLFSTAELTNVTVQGNTTDGSGGGVFILESSATIHNSTISGNLASSDGTATTSGGGIWTNDGGNLTLTNTAVADNTSGGALPTPADDDVRGTITNATNSFIGTTETITNGTGNINGGGDPGLGPLADNGGTTQTMAPLLGSPLVDAGDAALLPADTLDIDGDTDTAEALPLDATGGPRVSDDDVDIGAVEAAKPQSLVVDTLTDEDDGDFSAGDLSLREALTLVASGGEITFASGLAGRIDLDLGQLILTQDVTIDGDTNGDDKADIILDGLGTDRVMFVDSGTATLQSLRLDRGGDVFGGGGLLINTGATAHLIQSTVSNSVASGQDARGGGIYSNGTLTLLNSTVYGNQAQGDGTSFSTAYGGGLYTGSGATSTLTNTTIFGNNATNFGPPTAQDLFAYGGGIFARDGGGLTLTNSTVTRNLVDVDPEVFPQLRGGGLLAFGSSGPTITNSIIAGNIGAPDFEAPAGATYQGGNIIGGDFFSGPINQESVDIATVFAGGTPTLYDNGGPVKTVEILYGSKAQFEGDRSFLPLDAFDLDNDGNTTEELPIDANGDARVQNLALDLGAVQTRQSDLTVPFFDILDLEPGNTLITGQTFTYRALIENIGAGAAPDVEFGLYLSTDANVTVGDDLLDSPPLGSLRGSGTFSPEISTNLIGVAPGDYFLAGIADPNGAVTEISEANNTSAVISITVLADAPDLEWLSFAPSETDLVEGQSVDIGFQLVNTGSAQSPTIDNGVRVYLSDDNVITTDDTLIETVAAGALTVGGSRLGTVPVTLPNGILGQKFIGAILDPDDTLLEQDETNNVSPAVAVTITGLPDLEWRDFDLATNYLTPEQSVRVLIDIANTGSANSPNPTPISFYFSQDATITAADTLIEATTIGTVFAGGSLLETGNITLPGGISGTGFIGAIIDPAGTVDEFDDTNNATALFSEAVSITAPVSTGGDVIAETGNLFLSGVLPQTITLQNTFENPVVFAKKTSENEVDTATVRLSNVQGDRFTLILDEPSGYDDLHASEKVSWMVVEEGDWTLSDGTRLSAGEFQTNKLVNPNAVNPGFTPVDFTAGQFADAPMVQTQIQTANGADWVIARQKAATAQGVEIGMQEDETSDGAHRPESIGWLAMDRGAGQWDGIDFLSGATGQRVAATAVTEAFAPGFDAAPALLTSLSRFAGVDPAIARVTDVRAGAFDVKAQEEISADAELNHAPETVDYLALGAGAALLTGRETFPAVGETGTLRLTTNLATVQLTHSYDNPVVVAYVATETGTDPVNVRVTSITGSEMTLRLQEPNYLNGVHGPETVNYLVVEAGTHVLPDGTLLEAGTLTSSKLSPQGFEQVAFDATFDTAPVVLSQVQTANGGDFVTTRQRETDATGVEITMQEEEALLTSPHAIERIGWVAVEAGTGTAGALDWAAGRAGGISDTGALVAYETVLGADALTVAGLSTFVGTDPAWARGAGQTPTTFTVSVEEEQSADVETTHGREIVDFFAFSDSGTLNGAARQAVLETGSTTVTDIPKTVTLTNSFTDPVAMAFVSTQNGTDPVNVRITSVSGNELRLELQEPNNIDGEHRGETVTFVVAEAGDWVLPDGTLLEAGKLSSNKLTSAGFESVALSAGFDAAPVVMSHVQTFNGADFVTTRQQNTTATGFEISMQEEQALNGGAHASETLGWLAIEAGSGRTGGLEWVAGLADRVTDAASTVNYGNALGAGAQAVAGLASFVGTDPAWVRGEGQDGAGFAVAIEEDTSADLETAHTIETVSYFAFDQHGVLEGYDPDLFL